MDLSFYKKEAASLQNLFKTFSNIQFTSDQKKPKLSVQPKEVDYSKEVIIIGAILFLLIVGMVGFLTIWLLN